jgi:hypothetical protein
MTGMKRTFSSRAGTVAKSELLLNLYTFLFPFGKTSDW